GLYFVVFLGTNIQTPFVPLLVGEVYEGPDLPLAIRTVALSFGLLSAGSAPLLGRLAARFSSRVVLTVALLLGSAAMLGQARAPDYAWLVGSRAALGLVQGGTAP